MIDAILKNVPYLGAAYTLTKTALDVYNTTSPSGALTMGVKKIVLNCTPPVIKYPVLCTALVACGAGCIATGGNPLMISATTSVARVIITDDV